MKTTKLAMVAIAAALSSSNAVTIELTEYAFNIDGVVTNGAAPSGGDLSKFDAATGLGTILMKLSGAGAHFGGVFVDHEIDRSINSFFNEFGTGAGAPAAGQSWEIDEPGFVFGDIYTNFSGNALDHSVGTLLPDDVSMALGWNLTLQPWQTATVSFTLSESRPNGGFYLSQTDPDSGGTVYFSSHLVVSGENPYDPPIRDLAEEAKDAATFDSLSEKNKPGVFFSEGLVINTFLWNEALINLLKPWEGKGKWLVNDFLHASTGPIFFMNDGRYQALPGEADLPWRIQGNSLRWTLNSGNTIDKFNSRLNNPASKAQLYKRFEFPTRLNYPPQGSGSFGAVEDYDTDRAEALATARKLVIVIHGWNRTPDTDPYADGEWSGLVENVWPDLMENLSQEIKNKSPFAPGWDLYAYCWGKDAYTGDLDGNGGGLTAINLNQSSAHANGGVGLAQENGTQAAEIGYQHGLVLGKLLWEQYGTSLEKVQFIAHSAGTWVARSASLYLNAKRGALKQRITLLDPYNPHAGFFEWADKDELGWFGGEDSTLDSAKINTWAATVAAVGSENIYSDDKYVVGTNEKYSAPFSNILTGATILWIDGWGGLTEWDGHSGPINFYSYTVNPETSTYSPSDRWWRSKNLQNRGWENSLFMEEYRDWPSVIRLYLLVSSGFSVTKTSTPPVLPRGPGSPAPPADNPWKQILVDVDGNGWVRAMLVPQSGAAELAGPARIEPDGTFSVTLGNGSILTGAFDTSVSPAGLALALDGVPFGAKQPAAQGTITQRGFDATVNSAGNLVFSMVLADGTAGMSVAKDEASTGWTAAGVGTVDASGAFTVAGADGLQVTGQLLADGSLDTAAITVTPPQVPEIHVQGASGVGLTAGVSSSDCGSLQVGSGSGMLSLTIMNTGTVALTDLGVMVDGTHSGDFMVSALGVTTLAPDASAILNVSFSPGAAGSRTARLRITSNDANENPFDLTLTGSGFTATPLASATDHAAAELSAGGVGYFQVNVPEPGILICWSEGGTDPLGTLLGSNGVVLAEDNDSDLQANFRVSAVVQAGAYFIAVRGAAATTVGNYTLRTRFIPGTAPIQISYLEKDGDDVTLGFTNTAGSHYRIERSDDLVQWIPIADVVGTGAEMLVPFAGLGYEANGFLRVGLIPAGLDPDDASVIDLSGTAATPGGN